MQARNNHAHSQDPFCIDACGNLGPLRRALTDAGYSETAVSKIVLLADTGKPVGTAAVLERMAEHVPLHTLIRLFVLARAVPEDDAREALGPVTIEQILEIGLLYRCEEGVRAKAGLMFFDEMLLARDFWPDFTGRATPVDYVLGVGPASEQVAEMTVRRRVASALDLGTGCGFLALGAAGHADRVTGTDTNARALNFAALNARLNGIDNAAFRQGSLYEPVAAERFDLIMANPPFVISPKTQYEYRDSGMAGDTLSQEVIRGAADLLAEGGYCTVRFDWHHAGEDDWATRPGQWLGESGCDAWLLRSETVDPVSYACTWLYHDTLGDRRLFESNLHDWLAYYRQLGAGRISSGIIVMRRRSGRANWLRAETAPEKRPQGSCSGQIERIFAAEDMMQGLSHERDLLHKSLALAPEHQLEQLLSAEGGKWVVQTARLRQTQGFQFIGNIDRLLGTVLAGCDGRRTLGELAADLAAGLQLKTEQVTPACIAAARKLLETGFLTCIDDCGQPELN